MFHGFRLTAQEEGFRALARGWAPTFIGYSMQGLCKFGFYEVFKILYSNMLGEVSQPQYFNIIQLPMAFPVFGIPIVIYFLETVALILWLLVCIIVIMSQEPKWYVVSRRYDRHWD